MRIAAQSLISCTTKAEIETNTVVPRIADVGRPSQTRYASVAAALPRFFYPGFIRK